jgi:hypothetical protein
MFFSRKSNQKVATVKTLTGLVEQHLTEREFTFSVLSEGVIKTGIRGNNLSWNVYLRIDEDRKLITIQSVMPLCVGDSRLLNVADLLNRINYHIMLGKWCLDNEDGEVSHITTQLANVEHFTKKELEILLDTNFRSVDAIFPSIANVNFGNVAPIIAFNSIFNS